MLDLFTGPMGVCVATVGVAPSRAVVVEWRDVLLQPARHPQDFEVVLNEGSTAIDLLYRVVAPTPPGYQATVGLEPQRRRRRHRLQRRQHELWRLQRHGHPLQVTALGYWRRAWRFAVARALPDAPTTCPSGPLTVPYQPGAVVRYDGRTFEPPDARRPRATPAPPLRALYLAFSVAWPLVALAPRRAAGDERGPTGAWPSRTPSSRSSTPRATTPTTGPAGRGPISPSRCTTPGATAARRRYFLLDDKRHFLDVCRREGLLTRRRSP